VFNISHHSSEFSIPHGDDSIDVRFHTPNAPKPDGERALLLSFAGEKQSSLTADRFSLVAQEFVSHGHAALSFDLPNHGDQVDEHGEGITGMRNALVAGEDPFQLFVDRGRAVIDYCLDRGLATSDRIVVCGTSRGGYMALRLLAADARIRAGAGFAPVTDWRDLDEFRRDRERQDMALLNLSTQAANLAERAVFLVIGHGDDRVNTASCCQLFVDIQQERKQRDIRQGAVDFYCTDDPGHSCGRAWYQKGAEFLLEQIT
jgi:dienelactone hydrolase